jgi:hypothetical protein
MASDDIGEWLTYAEAGKRFGISPAAARQLSRRRGWQRRTPNAYGLAAQILVPADALIAPSDGVRTAHDTGNGEHRTEETASALLLAEAERKRADRAERLFDEERQRADRAERHLEEERRRVDEGRKRVDELRTSVIELQTALADAVAAERIAAGEVAALRAEADRRRDWGLLRRLHWALRRKPG